MSARSIWLRRAAVAFAVALSCTAHAGGNLSTCNSSLGGYTGPVKAVVYPGATPNIALHYDIGTLGARSKAQADAIVDQARAMWNGLSATSRLTLSRGSDLSVDQTLANYLTLFNNFGDDLNPVIYDSNGAIIDSVFGVGAKDSVLGFAGSSFTFGGSTCEYTEGRAVINGFASADDTTLINVVAHEIGHLFGLDHSQIDDVDQNISLDDAPLMYPIAFRSTMTLAEDDIAIVRQMYPGPTVASTFGVIDGFLQAANGTALQGGNVWARETTSGALYSSISDLFEEGNGRFRMTLPAGTYSLHVGAVDDQFSGGSNVGPFSNGLGDASFQPPFYNSGVRMSPVTYAASLVITAGCTAQGTFKIDGTGTLTGCGDPVAGVCGAANGVASATQPAAGLCAVGTASSVTTSGASWVWQCQGSNGGANASCAADVIANPPGAPTIGTAIAGNAQVSVAFSPPASNGGLPITSYAAACTPTSAGASGSASGAGSPIVVGSLSNGVGYTCTVTATNAIGTGPASSASNIATPVLSSPNGMLSFSTATASFAEGGTVNVVVTVSRTGGSTGAISVPWSTANGSAAIGSDFGTNGNGTQRSGTLSWAAGDTANKSVTIGLAGANVPVINDTVIETDETFVIALGSPSGGALLGATPSATVTITDNDGVTLNLTPGTRTVTEGAAAAFTVTRTGNTTSAFTVPWSIVHGSTTAPDLGTTGGTLSFAANATSAAISASTINDATIEGPETFDVVLGSPSLSGVVISNGTGSVTVTDNDSLVAVGAATATIAENGGTLQLPVSRSGSLGTTASVAWSATNGTARAGTDFGTSGVTTLSGSLSLPANAASANIAIPILNNAAITGSRGFTVTLNTATGATLDAGNKTVAVTITEDDKGIAMAGATASVAEGAGSVSVTVNRLGPPTGAVSATWSTANGTGVAGTHFGNGGSTTQLSGTLNWPDGDGTAKSIVVPILNDGAVNANRTFSVTLNSATGATLGTTKTTTVTIADDDNTLQFSAATATIAESTATLNLSVTRTGGTAGAASVVWATANGTAAVGSDFGSPGVPFALGGTLNWAGGDAAAKTISIPIINNAALSGGSRVFSVALSDPGGATIGANAGVQVTITDDEKGVAFASATHEVTEGTASIVLSVNRIGPTTQALAVPWSTANGSALAGTQFGTSGSTAQRSGTLSWAAGDAMAKNITIPILSNAISHGDTAFTVAIGTMPAGFIKGEPNVATVTVHDDDLPPESVVRFASPKVTIVEGPGANAQLTLTREVCSGGNCNPTLNRQVTVKYSTTAGSALAASDFTAASNAVVTFAPFETSKFVTIPITNNTTAEAAEAFTVTLSAPSPSLQLGTPATATVAVLDDDEVFPAHGLFPEGWGIPDQAPGVPGIGWHVATDAGAAEGFHTLKTDTVFDGESANVEIPARNYAAGNVTFKYRVSSEAGFDFLRFYVDGAKLGEWSGVANETTWATATFALTAGNHVLRWEFEKDGSVSIGLDSAWLDSVTLPAVLP